MQTTDSIRSIKGIGEKAEKNFGKLGIFTIQDLLEYYPRDYDVFQPVRPVASLQEGQTAAIEGFLKSRPMRKRFGSLQIISVVFSDESGSINVAWYNSPYMLANLHMGTRYILRGKVQRKKNGYEIGQPKIYTKEEFYRKVGKQLPIYSLTNGLTNNAVTKAVQYTIENVQDMEEYLPADVRKRQRLITYRKALKGLHFPENRAQYLEARKRMVFDELFLYTLALCHLKEQGNTKSPYPFVNSEELIEFRNNLPFTLTESQEKVYQEIVSDLCSGNVMNRLVQGDVGSGKTVIAIMALLLAVKNGGQGAFMVPTEVLAVQHFHTLRRMLEPYGVIVGLLTGSLTAKEKREGQQKLADGEWDIVIGTHAIIQEKVAFRELALVITDEQHRFGVKQRENLYKKGQEPHVLAMSATPIPRTLALVLYGDMDLSVIDTLPADRLPIKNCVVGTSYRPTAYKFMKDEIDKGHQVYIICPMVEESETMELENVILYREELQEVYGGQVRVQSLHGKMKATEKNEIMEQFAAGNIDILVSTTVIEVGIDVKNATTIMIENAERFGLAQLHQLRGRVGRGKDQSYCILMTGTEDKEAKSRLDILAKSNDGFFIASEDLKLRGQGDLFGVLQSGDKLFKLADIYEDARILQEAHEEARQFTASDISELCKKKPRLHRKLEQYMGYITI